MKRIKIYTYQVGLVFKNGNFVGVLTAGTHWLWFDEQVEIYDKTKPFTPSHDLDILLENEQLKAMLQIVEVKDNEIAFVYRDSNFKYLLYPGKYVFWESVVDYRFQIVDLNALEVAENMDRSILMRPELVRYVHMQMIEPYEQGLLIVDGHFIRTLMPGTYYFWKNDKSIEVKKVDLRIQQMEISGQEILTKDKAALRINFYMQYQIIEIEKALLKTKDVAKQLYLLMQMAIREYVGTYTLDELLSKKENVQSFVVESVIENVALMGSKIVSAGIRDIILPGEVKAIMNQVLVAEKKAQANTIMRREEIASTRSLLNTAKLMEDNAMLLKLKEMEYVEKIAEKINNITVSGGGQIVDQLRQIFVAEE